MSSSRCRSRRRRAPAPIRWGAAAQFPGLRSGEHLRRVVTAPVRGTLLARDGTPLADVSAAANLLGSLGAASGAQEQALVAAGFPADTPVGIDGLQQQFQRRLAGTPGGVLYAGRRLIAAAAPRHGSDVRTSISPPLQALAVTELGTSLGGIAVMDPATGEILAAAGRPLSELQPPGSTFKIVTLTGVLEAGIASAHTVFPYATQTVLDGFTLHNANGEDCGGTLAYAFAVSCNSVFAPLGARLGASRILSAAAAYGFNAPSPDLDRGREHDPARRASAAICRSARARSARARCSASPLQMLRVAATIALVGRRPVPTFSIVAPRLFPRVIPVGVARTVRSLMRDVVSYGTGTAAQIPGVVVAGKTGTSEVITPQCNSGATGATGATAPERRDPAAARDLDTNPQDTDAWFVAFAPEIRPRVVVSVLLPNDGAGGTSAAPLAKPILEAALGTG